MANHMNTYEINGIKIHADGYIWDNVQTGKDLIKAKFDNILSVDGMEGTGKSEIAFQWAIIQTNGGFSEKDVFYTADQFEEWIKTAKKGDVGVWDEFVLAGMSTDALTKMQNAIIKQFTVMRSKGLTVILVIPYFFMLRKYFAVARTRALIHVYANGLERGYLKFYNYTQKHYIYNYGQKTWLYSPKVVPSFFCRFEAWSDKFLDHKKIAKKKDEALMSITQNQETKKLIPSKKTAEAIMNANFAKIYSGDSSPYRLLNSYQSILKEHFLENRKTI